jgi:hypothetical protein
MSSHAWKFYRIGGLDQVSIETGEDLLHLHELDPKLWVALSCPVKGLEIDEKTLDWIDTDKDGRIRVLELLAAVQWAAHRLKDAGQLLKGEACLSLAAIDDSTPDGRAVLASARQIVASLGKSDTTIVALEDVTDIAKVFASTQFNGDGIVPPFSSSDPFTASVIGDIVTCLGAETDRSGKGGVSLAKTESFFAELAAYVSWAEKSGSPDVATLGAQTAGAAAAVQALRSKADDFFVRCRLVAFDSRSSLALNRSEADFLALAGKDLTRTASEFTAFPLAWIAVGASLPLCSGVNPAWAGALDALRRDAVTPLYGEGKTSLSEAEWIALVAKVEPCLAWQAAKQGEAVEKLGLARAKEILASGAKEAISALIARDLAVAPDFEAITAVERLLRYSRDLRCLLQNFINFFDFYSNDRHSIFQAGVLYLDSRSTELCIRVENLGAHSAMAVMSKVYIAYVECRRSGSAPMTIAACFTQGDSDYLFVGRNGVFYDRAGKDWDATIVKAVDNPISIGEAFWSPYKRVIRFVEEQVAKRAAAADAESSGKLQGAATAAGVAASTGKAPEQKPKFDVGTVAAMGVAVGGITAALGALLQAFFGLGMWMPLGVVGMIVLISGPAMIIAWLKLRQRNLGPLLEANGWAINGRVKINIPFGSALTDKAVRPQGSHLLLTDPYADKSAKKLRRRIYLVLVLICLLAVAAAWWQKTWPFAGA